MLNTKLLLQRARLLTSSSILARSSPQYQFLLAASSSSSLLHPHPFRSFHAGGPPGHTHDHDHDDGKQSHSDFQAKSKKAAPLSEEELNKQFAEWI